MRSDATSSLRDYPPEAYDLLVKSEETHFWFSGRNKIIHEVIRQTLPKYRGKDFLEVGCGTGYVLAELSRMKFDVTGLDMHPQGIVYAQKRVPSAKFALVSLSKYRPRKLFDCIGAFDVIEHIPSDTRALMQCAKLLKKGGMLYLTVPARPELWSSYDDISGHKRRYTKSDLTRLLIRSGYTIRYIGYFGFFQYLPHLMMKRFMLGDHSGDPMSILRRVVWQPPGLLNWLLKQSFSWDLWISKIIPLPFGTSLIVAAQKAV